MSGTVYQLVPVLGTGDGLGNHAIFLHQKMGSQSGGFVVEDAEPDVRVPTRNWNTLNPGEDDVLVYHFAMASRIGEWFLNAKAKAKILDFHNFTPPEFFRAYDIGLALALQNGIRELQALAKEVDVAIAHSEYSASVLREMGFPTVKVLDLLIDFSKYDEEPDPQTLDSISRHKEGTADILFVGRIAPNKRQEDLIKSFAIYKRSYNPLARLFLVGTPNSNSYMDTLSEFIERLGVEDIYLIGRVTHSQLIAYYRSADLFASCSAHEGFGIPWLEAMHHGLPVLTRPGGAIAETVGDAAVIMEGEHEDFAAAMHLMTTESALRENAVKKGELHLERFRSESTVSAYLSETRALLEA